jgi:hypothetical protein
VQVNARVLVWTAVLAAAINTSPAASATLSLIDQGVITRDPNTGLGWLDLSQTTNRSYNEVSPQFGIGGIFYGFRYATGEEVSTLFMDAGITGLSIGTINADAPAVSALINLLGPLQCYSTYCTTNGTPYFTRGIFNDLKSEALFPDLRWAALLQLSGNTQANVVYYDQFPVDAFYSDQGSFLVCDTCPALTPVPIHLPFAVQAIPFGVMGVFAWRRRRTSGSKRLRLATEVLGKLRSVKPPRALQAS